MAEDLARWPTGRLLAAAARRVSRDWNTHLESWDLNHASLTVLALLSSRDHSQRELADAVGVTEQTMSRVLQRMERTGYVARVAPPDDRRRRAVRLTEAGRAIVRDAADPGPAEEIATRGLSPAQVDQLRELLTLMIQARSGDLETNGSNAAKHPGAADLDRENPDAGRPGATT